MIQSWPKKWKQAITNRSKASSCLTAIRPTITRKVGYNVIDDEVAAAWEKMVNMNMNNRWYRYYLSIQRWKCWSKSLQWLGIVLLCLCDFNTARTIIIQQKPTMCRLRFQCRRYEKGNVIPKYSQVQMERHKRQVIQFQFHISWLHIWIGPQVLCIDDVHTCVEEVECKQVQKQADE